jgi:hypothetical protein
MEAPRDEVTRETPELPDGARIVQLRPPNQTGSWATVSSFLQYLYFMRFSILLWLSMPLLAVLDRYTGAAAATRGIVALNDADAGMWQFFFAAFFTAINGWIALLSARIVCAYGSERFLTPPPPRWAVLAGKDMSLGAFLAAQIPGLSLLAYVAYISNHEEHVPYGSILLWFLFGLAAALFCWVLIACIYYWLFWTKDPRGEQPSVDDNPKSFLVPYTGWFQGLRDREPSVFLLVLLEVGKLVAKLGPGYRNPDRPFNPLHSGHALALLSLGFIATVYGVFWDLTSPIILASVHNTVITLIIVVAALWTLLALLYYWLVLKKRPHGKQASFTNLLLMVLLFSPMLLVSALPFAGVRAGGALPVLASVSVLLLFMTWGLSALAFFLDRFRIPVLFVLVLISVVMNLLGHTGIFTASDHYIALTDDQRQPQYKDKLDAPEANLKTPDQFLDAFRKQNSSANATPRPVIIVTSTGGGIHAARWTAGILALLEKKFRGSQLSDGAEFHRSILLLSTVSGGSVGAGPWAAAYLNPVTAFSDKSLDEMERVNSCPELQAIAWGLTYADFLRSWYPYRHFFSNELDTYDRGWALQQAFWRNRQSKYCADTNLSPTDSRENTLGDLAWSGNDVPAFSFNTTVAETGDRFLNANYRLPKQDNPNVEFAPADSFLRVYRHDLPLSSAARMSANFPYVSPMPRVDVAKSHFHFGDGGYFDNDGTATAMEFLYYALNPGGKPPQPTANSNPPIRVLLVEIRDSGNPSGMDWPDDLDHQGDKDWGPSDQLTGPLLTFYRADHVSVTLRNRRELTFLKGAIERQAELTHIVFDYRGDPNRVQALSWHLTTEENNDIVCELSQQHIRDSAEAAVAWYNAALKGTPTAAVIPSPSANTPCPKNPPATSATR